MDEPEFEDVYESLSRPAWTDAAQVNRRRFLQGALAAGAIASTPGWISRAAHALTPIGAADGILVLVMLGGGNDGLNTLVPFGDANYARLRPSIGISGSTTLPIAAGVGLHPSLRTIKARYDQGKVAIVRGVGQASSDLSHFSSMANWMAGSTSSSRATGWIGRYLDRLPDGADGLRGVTIGESIPLHMTGASSQVTGLPTNSRLFGANRTDPWDAALFDAIKRYSSIQSGEPTGLGQWGDAVADSGYRAMARAAELSPHYEPALPEGALVRQMALAARLVNANLGIRVINTQLASFDTHSAQPAEHARLLAEFDAAIDAFYGALDPAFASRVTVMTFSEFGRRPEQNASDGTDHGAASVMLLMGDNVRGGLHGTQPSLTDLDNRGDLKVRVDLRSVYQSVLSQWLKADATAIIGGTFPALDLFTAAPGTPGSATGVWAPFATSKALVAQQYLDFLGRTGDQGGINYWAGLLEKKSISIEKCIESFLVSAEFAKTVSPASRIGLACTGSFVSYSSIMQWAAMIKAKSPLLDVAKLAVALPAFVTRYGSLTDQAFLDKAHRDVRKTAPTSAWTQNWMTKLNAQQATRAHVMLELSESADNIVRTRHEVDVTMTYVGMLRRAPDAGGYTYWVDRMRSGISIRSLVRLFFTSQEYRHRFA